MKQFLLMKPFNVWTSGMAFLTKLEMKCSSAISFAFKPYISFRLGGGLVSWKSFILDELGCILFLVMWYPRNCPSSPHVHLVGFIFICDFSSVFYVSSMSGSTNVPFVFFITMSWTYTSTFLPIYSLKIMSTRP